MAKTLLIGLLSLVVLCMAQPNYQERAIYLGERDNPCAMSDAYQDEVKITVTIPGQGL